jgi:ADP-glucose pyrophosphorylase
VAQHGRATVDPEAIVIESVIGDDVEIGEGCTVSNSLLLPGARLDTGAEVESSIVAGHVGAGASVVRAVIGADWSVPLGATIVDQRLPAPD